MKGFMKGCAIAALILVIAGIILGTVASTARGRNTISEVVESVTGGRVRLNLNAAADDFGFTIGDWDWLDEVDYEIDSYHGFDKEYDIQKGDISKFRLEGEITSLEIEAGGCYFAVKESGDENFYVEAEKVGKFQAYVKSGILHINTTTSEKKWSDLSKSKVVLYVPAGCRFERAEVQLGAGALDFPGLQASEASLEVGAGRITSTGITVSNLEVSVGAGQIELKDMDVSELEASVSVGEMVADGEIRQSLTAECAMGNFELLLAGAQEDYNFNLSGAMGNVSLGGEGYGGFASERRIDNGSDRQIEVECSMGNVSIQFEK